jgi:hypothetical protein
VNDEPKGFDTENIGYGIHRIRAVVVDNKKKTYSSHVVEVRVIPSNNNNFSSSLIPYHSGIKLRRQRQDSGNALPSEIQSFVNPEDASLRRSIVDMYRGWGVDLFLDKASDQSDILRSLSPMNWTHPKKSSGKPWSMMFSSDAVFYHAIPTEWPRIELPQGYFHQVQLNTAHGGDGIGFGQVVASQTSKVQTIKSQWYDVQSTLRFISYRIPTDWPKGLPTTMAGDRHVIFIDPQKKTFVSTYKASVNASGKGPDSLYAAGPTPFDSMGDYGGSIAANFAELPLLIQPGESTNVTEPIHHAIGGPVRRVWAARVYPASAWDAGVQTGKDTCSGTGHMNTGLVPYGGVIQLDPKLDLKKFKLSLPAFRILQAMQTYGYYVMDYGCTDLDIYTALDASEFDSYGGLWGSPSGVGVQNEIEQVIRQSTLYVVAPLYKKE